MYPNVLLIKISLFLSAKWNKKRCKEKIIIKNKLVMFYFPYETM